MARMLADLLKQEDAADAARSLAEHQPKRLILDPSHTMLCQGTSTSFSLMGTR